MKVSRVFLVLLLIISYSCSTKSLDTKFIENVSGRYLFNANEVIEVYSENNSLLLKWRGAEKIEPVFMGEDIFFIKEMNEKIKFLVNPSDNNRYISIIPKEKGKAIGYDFKKMNDNQLLPSEYLKNNDVENAIKGYLEIQQKDSVSEIVQESKLNNMGYVNLRKKDVELAINVFKINVALYPESSNVYDSLADALFQNKDTVGALENYKKALKLDSGNPRAKRFIKKYDTE